MATVLVTMVTLLNIITSPSSHHDAFGASAIRGWLNQQELIYSAHGNGCTGVRAAPLSFIICNQITFLEG